jgi:MarR family transcriptional regulator, transcriptional regulator for hemolysin
VGTQVLDTTDPAERFENALHNVARSWRHAVDRRLQCLGVSMASWMAIAAASQARSPLSQSELADALSISTASMAQMIDRLVKAGLATREPSPCDRRVNRIVITEAGHRLSAQAKTEAAAVRRQLLVRIESEKLAQLTELLEQLAPMS